MRNILFTLGTLSDEDKGTLILALVLLILLALAIVTAFPEAF